MNNPQVIGIGLNGLVGSRIVQVIENEIDFISLGKSNGVDITKPETLSLINDYPNADMVLLLAAKTDVDGCEKDKDQEELGDAWKINVEGTSNVVRVAAEAGKKLIYISTDFVFDGEKREGDLYSEEDFANPVNWYGFTKYEGEKKVEESGADFLIVRPAYPYRAEFEPKKIFLGL